MKAADILRFSLSNIRQNKSRSAITLIAVYLLGILVMGLLCTAAAFSKTSAQIVKNKLENVDFNVVYSSSSASAEGFKKDDYENLKNELTEYGGYISSVNVYFPSLIYCTDFDFFSSESVEITEGQTPSSALSGLNYIYLSEEYKDSYGVGDGYVIGSDGDEITLTVYGFYKNGGAFTFDRFADVNYMLSAVDANLSGLTVNCVKDGGNYDDALSALKKITNAVENCLPQNSATTYCAALELTSENRAESTLFTGGAALMAVVLLLLSIGSISNSMIISMDKNRRLSALMRAIGVTAKDLYKIFICECAITIISGIILAFFTLMALSVPLESLLYLLADFIYGYSAAELSAFLIYSFPAYIPALTAIFFIAFTLLFSVKVLREQIRKNPVEILGGEAL